MVKVVLVPQLEGGGVGSDKPDSEPGAIVPVLGATHMVWGDVPGIQVDIKSSMGDRPEQSRCCQASQPVLLNMCRSTCHTMAVWSLTFPVSLNWCLHYLCIFRLNRSCYQVGNNCSTGLHTPGAAL